MKKTFLLGLSVASLFLAANTFAADKEVTIKGEGKCAKCALKKADKCQNVIVAKEGDKEITYYLKGDASDKFHKNVCQTSKKVEATGTVHEADGKKELTVSSIKVAE
jgi:hypothetical protein